jgi:hypothetical protein
MLVHNITLLGCSKRDGKLSFKQCRAGLSLAWVTTHELLEINTASTLPQVSILKMYPTNPQRTWGCIVVTESQFGILASLVFSYLDATTRSPSRHYESQLGVLQGS